MARRVSLGPRLPASRGFVLGGRSSLELLWPGLDIQEVDAVGNDHDCIHDPPQLVGRNSDEAADAAVHAVLLVGSLPCNVLTWHVCG